MLALAVINVFNTRGLACCSSYSGGGYHPLATTGGAFTLRVELLEAFSFDSNQPIATSHRLKLKSCDAADARLNTFPCATVYLDCREVEDLQLWARKASRRESTVKRRCIELERQVRGQ